MISSYWTVSEIRDRIVRTGNAPTMNLIQNSKLVTSSKKFFLKKDMIFSRQIISIILNYSLP